MSRVGLAAMAIAALLLAGVMVRASRFADDTGFLLYFREEGRGVAMEGTLLLVLFCAAVALAVGAYADPESALLPPVATVAVMASLAAAVAFMLAFPSLPQFENKSLTARAILYPVLALTLPAYWLARRRRQRLPWLVEMSWTLALTVDIVGNDLHWYGNWAPWDDTVHFVNSLPLMFAITATARALPRRRPAFAVTAAISFGFYAAAHALWETGEYLSDRLTGTELQPGGITEALENTLAALAGSLLALAILTWWQRAGVFERAFVQPLASLLRGAPSVAAHRKEDAVLP